MKKTRIAYLLLAVVLLLTFFTACNKEEEKTKIKKYERATIQSVGEEVENPEEDSFGDNQKPQETLKIAINAAYPPFEYYDENYKIAGIDVDLAEHLFQKLGMNYEFVDMDFNSVVSSVKNGYTDIAISGLLATPERLEEVDLSVPYYTYSLSVIVKKGSGIRTISDLADKKIVVVADSIADIYASEDYGDSFVVRTVSADSALLEVTSGAADAFIVETETATRMASENDRIEVLGTEYASEEYVIAVPKDNPELLARINVALAELEAEGKIDEIIAKYIY